MGNQIEMDQHLKMFISPFFSLKEHNIGMLGTNHVLRIALYNNGGNFVNNTDSKGLLHDSFSIWTVSCWEELQALWSTGSFAI